MFDIGWQELFIVAVLALIVVGPKDMPRMIRTVRSWIRRAREMARDFQSGLDDVVREADLEDLRNQVNSASDPTQAMADALDPTGDLASEMDMTSIERELSDTAQSFKESTTPNETPIETLDDDPGVLPDPEPEVLAETVNEPTKEKADGGA